MNCKYCGKILSSKGASHQIYCTENPNRRLLNRKGKNNPNFGKKGKNQYIKAKEEGRTITVSEETREKISISSKGRKYTPEQRKKMSEVMQRVVRENPESYSASNINGRCKKVLYKDVWLDSKWEYEFAKWCDDNSIIWEKCKRPFEYEWNGSRLYYPDFYLEEYDKYVEVKGYERERDRAKWKVVPNLLVVKSQDIKLIRSGKFSII